MTAPSPTPRRSVGRWLHDLGRSARESFVRLAHQHTTPARLGAAVATGAVVGTTPFFGFHMVIGAALGRALRLNQVAVLAGEQVSLPFLAPLLAYASIHVGHRVRSGGWLDPTAVPVDLVAAAAFFADWLVGSLAVGLALGAALGLFTATGMWLYRRRSAAPPAEPSALLGPRQRWTGRGRGSGLGFAIFFHTIRVLGHRGAYALIWPVLPYFIAFAPAARHASSAYLERALGARRLLTRVRDTWRHFEAFARSMVDDMLLLARREGVLTYSNDGFELIRGAYSEGRGVLLLSAHVGNRGLAGAQLEDIKANIVAFENEAQSIRRFLDRHRRDDTPNLIEISDGPAAAVSILTTLKRGELVAMLADRARGDSVYTVDFLGSRVDLPAGPFLVAVLSGAPTLVTFAPKLASDHQHFYARRLPVDPDLPRQERRARAEALAQLYARELEAFVERFPYQWYNFYDYFGDALSRTDDGATADSPKT